MAAVRRAPALRRPLAKRLALAAGGAQAAPEVYDMDAAHSQFRFEVLHIGTSTSRGHYAGIEGAVAIDRAAGSGEVGSA